MEKAFQDCYADRFSHCYGCGRLNPDGLQLKSYRDGDDTIARFTPRPEQSGGVPNHVYGGLIASLLDCHGTASAAAFVGMTPDFRMISPMVAEYESLLHDGVPIPGVAPGVAIDSVVAVNWKRLDVPMSTRSVP